MLSISEFADNIQVPLNGVKLVLTVYLGYVFGIIHRRYFFSTSAAFQNEFFTAIGILLMYWNYGMGIIHSATCIIMQWLFFRFLGANIICVAMSFIFQLGYLVGSYLLTATDDYDITWTMPHCVLTLRLIGLCWDVYDGHRDETKLSAEQRALAIRDMPSLLEIFGYCYYYGGFMIGPQFPLCRFRQMVNGELTDNPGKRPHSIVPAFLRGLSGTIIFAIHIYLDKILPVSTMLQPDFLDRGFLYIVVIVCVRAQILLLTYISMWMITEGVCILNGLSYHKEGDTVRWDGVCNVKLRSYLTCRSILQLIQSFNVNTNQWVARYVFKRLRFLGNRTLSHLASLLFIAVWHGYHEGYFTVFFAEFMVVMTERSLIPVFSNMQIVRTLNASKSTAWVTYLCGLLYYYLIVGYCHLDIVLRKWRLYAPIQQRMYCYGHVLCLVCLIVFKIHSLTTKQEQKAQKSLE